MVNRAVMLLAKGNQPVQILQLAAYNAFSKNFIGDVVYFQWPFAAAYHTPKTIA